TSTVTKYVSFTIDNTNPVISNIQVNNITNTTTTIAWATNKPTTGQVSYRIDGGTYGPPVADSDGDKQVFIAELQPNTLYYYQITVTDNYGHTTASAEQSFTTTNVNDTTPPGPPTWIAATGRTNNTVDLSWKAGTDNTGIAGYKLYRSTDGSSYIYITTVSGSKFSYTDTGLDASTVYYYKLTSLDLAGNESALADSTAITVPTVGAARVNPHGAYPKLTDMCGKCHVTHRALKSNLFKDTQEQKVCFTCHNGTGSQYNVQMEYDPSHVSRHPLPMAHTGKECASCHNPHLTASDSPRLLAPKKLDGTSESKGPQVCLVCHGTEVVSKVASEIGGSHEGFLTSSHYTSLKMPNPPSGSQIKCVNCHNNHSSAYIRLTKDKEEQNCFQCHSARQGAPPNMVNIEGLFNLTSRHKVSDADQADGSRVECVNCHNPHYVTSANRLADPDNTNIKWTADTTSFCLKCHDSGPYPVSQVDSTTVVPYSINFPAVSFSTNPGGWNKTGYLSSGHSARSYQCAECHDPHGSNNTWLTKSFEEGNCTKCHDGSTAGAANINGLLGKAYKHPVIDPAKNGTHSNTENYASILTRHAECTDCHNPHEANSSIPTVRNGVDQGPLKGVSGVGVNWANVPAGAEPAPGDFIIKPGADLAAEVCLKCHSNYAYGATPPSGQTNQAKEFNPANSSVHPVFGSGNNPYTTSTATNGNKITMEAPFNQTANEHTPLKCTDCHGVDTTAATYSADTNVKGPHGSSNQYMLKKDPNSDAFCLLCHKTSIYKSGGAGSRFNKHNSHSSKTCRTCHGGTAANRKGMIHGTNAKFQDIIGTSETPTTNIRHFLSGDAFTGWIDGTPGNAKCYTTQHDNNY
ncbi:MAG: cytochrome c3 family protein, partial [Carboxydocellales bacterium]